MKNTIKNILGLFTISIIGFTACKKEVEPLQEPNQIACDTCPSHHYDLSDTTISMDSTRGIYISKYKSVNGLYLPIQNSSLGPIEYFSGIGYTFVFSLNINIDLNKLPITFSPNKVSFVCYTLLGLDSDSLTHQYLNIQLPNTPLIVTTSDSLQVKLSPYGYNVQLYNYQGMAEYYQNNHYSMKADSIVIHGNNIDKLTIGIGDREYGSSGIAEAVIQNICFSKD